METLILQGQEQQVISCVATIGMFDGVHEGHRFVLRQVCDYAKEHHLASCVITFDRHPREVVQEGWKPQLLTTYDERMRLLEETGIDRCVVLSFTRETAHLSARDFIRLMSRQLGVRALLTGYDNRFGHHRSETFDDYVRYGKETGMEVRALPPLSQQPKANSQRPNVSSSLIRKLLAEGAIKEAARCLTYPYSITGKVIRGEHIGTRLGFPTANLQVNDPCKMIPAPGVYAVRCHLPTGNSQRLRVGERSSGMHLTPNTLPGMMNIGTRPTFGAHQQTLEVHILDYDNDLYGQDIQVEFIERLREERPFDSEETLRDQLKTDKENVRKIIAS